MLLSQRVAAGWVVSLVGPAGWVLIHEGLLDGPPDCAWLLAMLCNQLGLLASISNHLWSGRVVGHVPWQGDATG